MDLNLKGKSWAGKIYHQFESLCQDVDEFISKETVKSVENQMQSVGISVKRFYSNVVQDILPLPGDIVRPESQSVDGKQVDTWDHVNSVTDIRTNTTCTNEKQLPLNQGSVDTLRNSDVSLPIEADHVTQCIEPPHADSSQEAEIYPHLREDGHAITWNDGIEDNITRDSIPVTSTASPKSEIFTGNSDEVHKHSTLNTASSPAFSAHVEAHIAVEKEKRVFNQQKRKEDLSNEAGCLSNISNSHWLSESKLPMVEDPNSDNRSLCAPPVASVHKVNEDNSFMMDLPLPLACDVARRALGKDGTICLRLSTKDESFDSDQSPEFVLSYFSCDDDEEEEEEEMGITSSTYSTSTKYSHILESTSANAFEKTKNICHSPAEPNDLAYNISTPSSTTEDYERKAEDMLPAFLIVELNDDKAFPTDGPDSVLGSSEMKNEQPYKDVSETAIFPSETDDNAFPTDGPDFVFGSSEMRHEQPYKDGKSETAIFPSETGNTCEFGDGIDDHYMETVDLSPDVKHNEISVCLNSNFVHAASHQRKNLKYYKKLIQDAFTSRKRLSKEYEHFAILYGDIDMDSSLHFEPTSSPNTSVHALRTLSSQEMSETEWELI